MPRLIAETRILMVCYSFCRVLIRRRISFVQTFPVASRLISDVKSEEGKVHTLNYAITLSHGSSTLKYLCFSPTTTSHWWETTKKPYSTERCFLTLNPNINIALHCSIHSFNRGNNLVLHWSMYRCWNLSPNNWCIDFLYLSRSNIGIIKKSLHNRSSYATED